jgi:hypothetical protein
MAMTYTQWLAANKLKPTAANAVKWLKSGQAPAGTPIPASLQSQFGGATQVTGPATSTPSSFDVPLAPGGQPRSFDPYAGSPESIMPAPTITPPQNPYLPQLTSILQQMANLGAVYNPQRQAVAANTAAQLAGSGLVDYGTNGVPRVVQGPNGPQIVYDYTQQAGQTANPFNPALPNVEYRTVQGADGRAYLQAFANVAHANASRGVFSGSQVDQQQQLARQGLDTQRTQAMNQMQQGQAEVTGREQSAVAGLQGNWNDFMSQGAKDATSYIADQQVTPRIGTPLPMSGSSPLTQLTGGQNTVTGGTGGSGVKPQATTPTWAQFVKSHQSPTGAARTRLSGIYRRRFGSGVTTRPT